MSGRSLNPTREDAAFQSFLTEQPRAWYSTRMLHYTRHVLAECAEIVSMSRTKKLIDQILSGRSDANIRFDELVSLLERLGFRHRSKGSHHVFTRSDVRERITLQAEGSKAKRYQVKQVRDILTQYGIGDEGRE